MGAPGLKFIRKNEEAIAALLNPRERSDFRDCASTNVSRRQETLPRKRGYRCHPFPARCEQDLIRDIKPGAVVIDCSTEGNLHQDVAEKAAYISTHDNHLGQITTALALYNTALCALWQTHCLPPAISNWSYLFITGGGL
jgi:hypothetical protein